VLGIFSLTTVQPQQLSVPLEAQASTTSSDPQRSFRGGPVTPPGSEDNRALPEHPLVPGRGRSERSAQPTALRAAGGLVTSPAQSSQLTAADQAPCYGPFSLKLLAAQPRAGARCPGSLHGRE